MIPQKSGELAQALSWLYLFAITSSSENAVWLLTSLDQHQIRPLATAGGFSFWQATQSVFVNLPAICDREGRWLAKFVPNVRFWAKVKFACTSEMGAQSSRLRPPKMSVYL
jgi:hypothetical protein